MKIKARRIFMPVLIVFAVLVMTGCATTKVTRVEPEEMIDLSGGWNDYDAMLVAEEMVADSLGRPWLGHFIDNNERNPVVIVGHVVNRTHEHIDSEVFTKYLERELLNSGKVIFVASSEEREQMRNERDDQQEGNTAQETMAAIGRERGADYMIIGSLHSVKDEVKGKFAISYQVNLELIDLLTNEKVWIGQKTIKKKVEKKRFSL